MERQVIFTDDVDSYLKELSDLLFEKSYFSFPEDAKSYVDRIVDYMTDYIGILQGKPAPPYFNRYGRDMEYIRYPANHYTSWYGFYQQVVNRFYVRHITNNHVAAQYF